VKNPKNNVGYERSHSRSFNHVFFQRSLTQCNRKNRSLKYSDDFLFEMSRNSNNDVQSRQHDSTSSDLRSRYWTYLFDNLKRSIEQIYQTCESDPNSLECQVVFIFISLFHLKYIHLHLGSCPNSSSILYRFRTT
jgi:hypothetical protein